MLVARLLHQITHPDPHRHYALLSAARGYLEKGGPARIGHTFPSLIFCGLQIVRKLAAQQQQQAPEGGKDTTTTNGDDAPDGVNNAAAAAGGEVGAEGVLQWLLEVCLMLAEVPAPLPALRAMLCCAQVASEEAGLEMLTYEFFEQVSVGGVVGVGWGVV